jgi:hypothetical protein
MSQFDCQNLTSSIAKLSGLKARVDLALNKFEPGDGLKAKGEISLELSRSDLLVSLGYVNFKYLVDRLGSVEELEKRVSFVELGNLTYDGLRTALAENKTHLTSRAADMLGRICWSAESRNHDGYPDRIRTIRLSPEDVGANKAAEASVDLFYYVASNYCLKMCPPISAAYVLLQQNWQIDASSEFYIAMDMIPDQSFDLSVFGIRRFEYSDPTLFTRITDGGHKIGSDSQFIFYLPDKVKQ